MDSREIRSLFLTFQCFDVPNTRFEWSWLVVGNALTVSHRDFNPERISMGTTFDVSNPAEFQTALNTTIDNGEHDTINVAVGTYTITTTLTNWLE